MLSRVRAILYAGVIYWLESQREDAVLWIVAVALGIAIESLVEYSKRERVQPFHIRIEPLREFFVANGLATEEQLTALDTPEADWPGAMEFTVIEWRGVSGLIFWNASKRFTSVVKGSTEYKPLAFQRTKTLDRRADPPEFLIDAGGAKTGFQLAVRRSGEFDPVPVTLLPYAAFWPLASKRLTGPRRDTLLRKHGWKDTSEQHASSFKELAHEQFRVIWMEV